jgi:hypothetical protein
LRYLGVQRFQQLQKICPALRSPSFQRQLVQDLLPRFAPQLSLQLHTLVQHQVMQAVLHPGADTDQAIAMDEQLPQIAVRLARDATAEGSAPPLAA